MAIEPGDLSGTWSNYILYAPGAMEDCLVYFGPDQRGCILFSNLGGASGAVFEWHLEDGRLTTTTRGQYDTDPGEFEGFHPGDQMDLVLVAAEVDIRVEATPSGNTMRVLHLPPDPLTIADMFGFESSERHPWLTRMLAETGNLDA